MKVKIKKYWRPLATGGILTMIGAGALYKKGAADPFDNTEGRKRLSDFQLAEAQSGKAHTLKENEFADRKAQEAFATPKTDEPKPTPRPEESAAEIAPSAPEDSPRARAAKLLGAPLPEASPEPKQEEISEPVKPRPKEPSQPKSTLPARSRERGEGRAQAKLASERPEVVAPPPMVQSFPQYSGSGVYAKNPPSVMAKLDDSNVTETVGSRSTYVRGDLLKMGSVYLAKIDQTINVRGSRTQNVDLSVFGKASPHTINQPFMLRGLASLSDDAKTIDITIKDCISSATNAKAIPCDGEVESLDGSRGLNNEIYSPSIWPSILDIIGEAGNVYSLGRMSQSVTDLGVLTDISQSNALWGAAGAAWKKTFDNASRRLEAERDGGKASGGAIVKVRIGKDTALW